MKLLVRASQTLLVVLIVAGCHPTDQIKPQNFYTIQVSADYPTSQSDNWVMASDENGNWLDAQPYEAGQTITLNGVVPPSNTFTLHFFMMNQSTVNGFHPYEIGSYTAIPVGGTWQLNYTPPSPAATSTGTATIAVTNLPPNYSNMAITTAQGQPTGQGDTFGGSNFTFNDIDLYAQSTDFIITFANNNQFYYLLVNGVTPGSTPTVDAASASPTSKQIILDGSPYDYFYGAYYGYNSAGSPSGFAEFFEKASIGNTIILGYLPGLDYYTMLLIYGTASNGYTYYREGAPITQLPTLAPVSVTQNSVDISAYSATSNLPFDVSTCALIHSVEQNFSWVISQPKTTDNSMTFSVRPFPSSMTKLYPALDVSKMRVNSAGGTQLMDGSSYLNWVYNGSNNYYSFYQKF